MALKLDMSKTYDRIEWVYLERLMSRMGFCDLWINLIMICVKTVTYSILVNGEPQSLIQPTRELGKVIYCLLSYFFYVRRDCMG